MRENLKDRYQEPLIFILQVIASGVRQGIVMIILTSVLGSILGYIRNSDILKSINLLLYIVGAALMILTSAPSNNLDYNQYYSEVQVKAAVERRGQVYDGAFKNFVRAVVVLIAAVILGKLRS